MMQKDTKLTTSQIKSLSKVVTLPKKATTFEAWEALQKAGYDASVHHTLRGPRGNEVNYITVELVKDGNGLKQFAIDGETADEIVESDFAKVYDVLVDGVIAVISRKGKKTRTELKQVVEDVEEKTPTKDITKELDELTTQRNRIAMRIHGWKKTGKDYTELEKEKADIVRRIEELRAMKASKNNPV